MTPEELSQLRKLCEGPAPFGGWPADMLQLVNEVDRLQDLHAEANKLLEQTIEVLEGFEPILEDGDAMYHNYYAVAKPLLDNLKALKKEGTE